MYDIEFIIDKVYMVCDGSQINEKVCDEKGLGILDITNV